MLIFTDGEIFSAVVTRFYDSIFFDFSISTQNVNFTFYRGKRKGYQYFVWYFGVV